MASRRILTFTRIDYLTAIIIAGSLLIVSCGTTKKSEKRNTPSSPSNAPSKTNNTAGVTQNLVRIIASNRSKLSDVYASQNNNIPLFLMQDSTNRGIGDPDRGYRIQILSTREVAKADSVANEFRSWAINSMKGYIPKTYVQFKQPYYKIRVGNFQYHSQALKLNDALKKRYPGAWVVNDKVEPNLVPPDTTNFNLNMSGH